MNPVHCLDGGLGVHLHDACPEDPDRLPRAGRLLGCEGRAEPSGAGVAAGGARPRAAPAVAPPRPSSPAAPRPPRLAGPQLRANEPRASPFVSTGPVSQERPADAIAGLLAALSVLASAIGLVYRPARLIPFALLLAIIAA